MLGFPAMSTFRKSNTGAEVKRGYVRVATAVATKSAPPPPSEEQQRQEGEPDASETADKEGVECRILNVEPSQASDENFSTIEVDDSAVGDATEQVILATEGVIYNAEGALHVDNGAVHIDEGFPIHIERVPTPQPPSPPPTRTPTPPATPKADKAPINRWGADKPPLSYAALIALVLDDLPDGRGTLNDLYKHITENFPFYAKLKSLQWQNSIRHNLSLHPEFLRIKQDSGRGGLWTVKPGIDKAALIRVKGEKQTPPPTPPTPANREEDSRGSKTISDVFKVPEPVQRSSSPAPVAAAAVSARNSRSGSPKRQSLEEFLGLGRAEDSSSGASTDKTMTVLSAMDCDNDSEDAANGGGVLVPMPPKGRHQQRKPRPKSAHPAAPPPAQTAKSGGRFSGCMDYWEQYDPEEASRTGRAVVTTEEGAPASDVCFLCGSAGQVRTDGCSAGCILMRENG